MKCSMPNDDGTITKEMVDEILNYDCETGVFLWKKTGNNRTKPGDVAGHVATSGPGRGYRRITLGGRRVMAHRIAWLMVHGEWPRTFIDHIDGNPDNNSAANLRIATKSQNKMNQRTRSDNRTGLKGVCYVRHMKRRKRYAAVIRDGERQRTIGYFHTPEEAHAAYAAAARIAFGEFARTE